MFFLYKYKINLYNFVRIHARGVLQPIKSFVKSSWNSVHMLSVVWIAENIFFHFSADAQTIWNFANSSYLIHVVSDKFHRLLERVRIAAARINHDSAECDIRQQFVISIDLIDGEQHRFESLNALFFFDGTTRVVPVGAVVFVHRKDATENNVTGNPDEFPIIAVTATRVNREYCCHITIYEKVNT